MKSLIRAACAFLAVMAWAAPSQAQVVPCSQVAESNSTNLPPATSPPVYRCAEIKFHSGLDRTAEVPPMIDPQTYGNTLRAQWSQRSRQFFPAYSEQAIQADFWNLMRLGFLEDLWIEVFDEPYENGVLGKHVVFHMEERARVKMVDYTSAKAGEKLAVDISKIESTLKDNDVTVALDSFVDESKLRQVIGVIKALYAEEGYNDALVTIARRELPGGPKLLHVTFTIDPGPRAEIAEILFEGNEAFSDSVLRKQMKGNKTKRAWMPFFNDTTYRESRFAEDSERVAEYYKNNGYAAVQIGQPQIDVLRTTPDGQKRWIRLRVPVDEGRKYKVGTFELTGDKSLNLDAIKNLFGIKEGDDYSNEKIRKGLERAKEVYGMYGFWQFAPDPDLKPRGIDPDTGQPVGPEPPPPIMDISIKINEGKQFKVHRMTFTGNTTTHDTVIRREMRLVEGGLYNAEALKDSVRRLNQLGYFKPIEQRPGRPDESTEVTTTPGTDDQVDIKLKFEEQNRNQISFGAGVSQFDGFFGQLSFQTSNFLGRGETVGISLQKGSQARQYQVSFSEPYLFERPITAGIDLFSREYIYPYQYTQQSSGSNWVFGFPVANYMRGYLTYSYERVTVSDINPAYLDPRVQFSSPYLVDSLLLNLNGRRIVSKVTPSLIFNTVNQPIFPTDGKKYTLSLDIAGLGGNTEYLQGRAEHIFFHRLTNRTSFGTRAEVSYIRPYGSTYTLPIFEKLFSGGEYTVRGFDLRAISPRDPVSGVLIGGNKMINLNAEYYIQIMSQLRFLLFFDAGQVRDIGDSFAWKEPVTVRTVPPPAFLLDPFATQGILVAPGDIQTLRVGETLAFKASTGVEVRFMMPVLNVPFRLIGAYNPSRVGVLDNQLRPAKEFTFRFAVGTTF